jgi:hypothetical protein
MLIRYLGLEMKCGMENSSPHNDEPRVMYFLGTTMKEVMMSWICNSNVDTRNACQILWGNFFETCNLKERTGHDILILRWNFRKLNVRRMEMFPDRVQWQALITGR